MSHPDPCYDPDNSYEDDMNYDDHDDFYGESMDYDDYNDGRWEGDPERIGEWAEANFDEDEDWNDSMDGDHDSAMDSIGWGDDDSLAYGGGENDYGDW